MGAVYKTYNDKRQIENRNHTIQYIGAFKLNVNLKITLMLILTSSIKMAS